MLCHSGGGADSQRTNKVWQIVCMHYSVSIRTLSIEKTGHCICPAVLYENLALPCNRALYIPCSTV